MRKKLLEILVDPLTGEPLVLETPTDGEVVEEGTLLSPSGRRVPIVRGVPRFVPDEDYAGSFGLQWNRFARVQLDSVTGGQYSKQRFDDETGWTPDELRGQWVVDAGCGPGRFAEVAAGYGAEVLAVDLSSAVDAAQRNLGHLPNVHVIQADLRSLPVRREALRYLYSIGVLQHTPDPLAAAAGLVALLPPGGRFTFTIYGRRRWTRLFAKYWVRPVTTRLPQERLLAVIERLMPVLFPLTSFLFRIPKLGRVFAFLIPVANYVEQTDLPREINYQESILNTFDMLAPQYDNPVTADEVAQALAGVAVDVRYVSRVPVIARGTRASSDSSVVG